MADYCLPTHSLSGEGGQSCTITKLEYDFKEFASFHDICGSCGHADVYKWVAVANCLLYGGRERDILYILPPSFSIDKSLELLLLLTPPSRINTKQNVAF